MSSSKSAPEPTGDTAEEVVGQERVRVRRAPRYGVFIGLGAFLGFVAAFALTFAFPENEEFTVGQVFGFLLLIGLVVGVAAGGAVAIVIDAMSGRRARAVGAERIEWHGAADETR